MTLVILAAGMGSRFGGLKQIEPVGPNGEFIIDYSIYDAIKAGFDKVVFIIKEENYDIFRETIGKRIEGKINVEYVFQDYSNVPGEFSIPDERVKPLGTGHAILCAKSKTNEVFITINADDFYGRDAFFDAAKFIKNNESNTNYGTVSYNVVNTLTSHGSVKRGVCLTEGNKLLGLEESKIENEDGIVMAYPLSGAVPFKIEDDTKASVNFFVFYPTFFDYLENDFKKFLSESKDLINDEYMVTEVLRNNMVNNNVTCDIINTNAVWKGITYADDLIEFKKYIASEIESGVYPVNLYD